MKLTVPKKEVACYNTDYTITRRDGRIDWSEIPVLKIDQVLWLPIKEETPNFHRPEFFGKMTFEGAHSTGTAEKK